MKKTWLMTASMLITFSSATFAANDEQIIVKKREKVVYEDTSEANRIGKTFNVNAQLWGAGPQSIGGSGLSAGYFLNSNNLIHVEAMAGKSESGFWGSKWERNSSSFAVHYKQFVGNSFYWRAGGDYSQVKSTYKYNSTLSTNSVERELSGNVVSASLVIGNQWQWENFTLGCDWIGLSAPISGKTTQKYVKTTFEDNWDQKVIDEEEDRLFKNGGLHLLRFYLGASF